MYRTLILLVGLFLAFPLSAQLTLTADHFPAPGDTLRTVRADTPDGIDLLSAGENRNWEFSNITGEVDIQPVMAVGEDTTFAAELTIRRDSTDLSYFLRTPTAFSLVGTQGELPRLPGIDVDLAYEPERIERRTGVTYLDRFETETRSEVMMDPDSVPESLLPAGARGLLSGVAFVRLTITSQIVDDYDAYGTVTVGGRVFEVLRQKRTEIVERRLSAPVGNNEVDVTNIAIGADASLADILGEQAATTTYSWWNNGSKEAIARAELDADGNLSDFRVKSLDATSSTPDFYLRQADISMYPNPATDQVTFEIDGLGRGGYYLDVMDTFGRRVKRQEFFPRGNPTRVRLYVGDLAGGTYFYTLSNAEGRIVGTQRLVVR